MTIKTDEFRQYLQIDKSALDDEIVHQPMLFYQVGEALTEANAVRDHLKEQLAAQDAVIEAEVRRMLAKANIRDTKDLVAQHVQLDPRHTKAMNAYLDAKKNADLLATMKDAFQQRSYMLRDLCSLFVSNFYEDTSRRGTNASDTVVYNERRKAMANGRAARAK